MPSPGEAAHHFGEAARYLAERTISAALMDDMVRAAQAEENRLSDQVRALFLPPGTIHAPTDGEVQCVRALFHDIPEARVRWAVIRLRLLFQTHSVAYAVQSLTDELANPAPEGEPVVFAEDCVPLTRPRLSERYPEHFPVGYVEVIDEDGGLVGVGVAVPEPVQSPAVIMAIDPARRTNGDLIRDCHRLGYLRNEDVILDPTFGRGTFWQRWHPLAGEVVASDLHPSEVQAAVSRVYGWDFTDIPREDLTFDACTFDPPYKLNGTPSEPDVRYGVHRVATITERHALIAAGIRECARVTKRHLLVKCMDQVSSGRVQWQTRLFTTYAEEAGFHLVDMLHLSGSRAQPGGRRQVHARRNYSTMLVLERA